MEKRIFLHSCLRAFSVFPRSQCSHLVPTAPAMTAPHTTADMKQAIPKATKPDMMKDIMPATIMATRKAMRTA